MSLSGEQQYLALCKGILQHGTWVENQRTGKKCLTIINADLTYDVGQGQFPLLTTRKCFYKSAIAELLGYLRGFDNAEQFRALGTKTWDANANDNRDWLANPARKGQDDCGMIYGKVARNFPKVGGGSIDLLHKVVQNLSQGVDDRAEIITFYHPGAFHLGCLRPCMYSHHFSLLGDTLHLTSYQRSCDVPLGLTFNMVQVHTLLALMAQITGHKPGKAYHKIVNAHVYEDQVEQLQAQVLRKPYAPPKLHINPDIKTLDDIESWVNLADFVLTDYQHHEAIRYAFAV